MKIREHILGRLPEPGEEKSSWDDFRRNPESAEARERLVEVYLPLVVKVVNSMPLAIRQKLCDEELIGSGVVGLHDAISSFSDDKNVQFSTFAFKRIKGAILDDLRGQDHLTRTQRSYYREICAAINRLTGELCRPPTDQELAAAVNLPEGEIDKYIGMGGETVSLTDEFEDGLSYQDVLADTRAIQPDVSAHLSLALDRLRDHFLELEGREQKILFLRYFQEMSVKEIAAAMEISEGRVSQIYQKILLKLRALMETR